MNAGLPCVADPTCPHTLSDRLGLWTILTLHDVVAAARVNIREFDICGADISNEFRV